MLQAQESEPDSEPISEPDALPGFSSPEAAARPSVAEARRVVIKIGTRVITDDDGFLASSRLSALVATAAAARQAGREVILVSSGALGLGIRVLGFDGAPKRREQRRACAAVGQAQLMSLYEHRFGLHGLTCGQVLVGQGEFHDRDRHLQLRRTLEALLSRGVVPILNENDAVGGEVVESITGEPRPIFGENDRLAALIAGTLEAQLLVLLTDVPGVYDKHPGQHPDATLLSVIVEAPQVDFGAAGSTSSRGGMRSKVDAAFVAATGGCQAVIASGRNGGTLSHLLAGEEVGSWFPARGTLAARDRWIAFSTACRGTLQLDQGAVDALRGGTASLLTAGVVNAVGDFKAGDVVELRGPNGRVVGRGQIKYPAPEVRRWVYGHPQEAGPKPLIRRNFIVLLAEEG